MDYVETLKKAWQIIYKRPYLWILGLLAGGYGGFSYQIGGTDLTSIISPNFSKQTSFLARAADNEKVFNQVLNFVANNWVLIVVASILLFLIIIALIVLSIVAKAGLIKSVDKIDRSKDKNLGFLKALSIGLKYFWHIFLFNILIGLILVIVGFALMSPLIFGTAIFDSIFFVFWLSLSVLIMVPLAILMGLVDIIGSRSIVLENKGVIEAINHSYRLIKENIMSVFLSWLLMIVVGFAGGFGLMILGAVISFAGILLVLLGLVINKIVAWILGIVVGLIFLIIILIAGGFIQSLISAYWTLYYNIVK